MITYLLQQKSTSIWMILLITLASTSCIKPKYTINYELGIFPDSVVNLQGVNSEYDDYNSAGPAQIDLRIPLVFSTNRFTEGKKFDLINYNLWLKFNKTDGTFGIEAAYGSYPFSYLVDLANSDAHEFGPINGSFGIEEYIFCFASDRTGNMEIYTSYWTEATFSGASPMDPTPFRIKGINSPFYDAYPSFTLDFTKMIFCSNRDGNLDFYTVEMPPANDMLTWLKREDSTYTATPVVELNSPAADVCPYINGNLIVFTSKREGGYGGYDLWYAKLENDGFSEPVNFGPKINTEYDEFRPIVMFAQLFENDLMIFSSNRPGGKGGFDLYYTGIPRMTTEL